MTILEETISEMNREETLFNRVMDWLITGTMVAVISTGSYSIGKDSGHNQGFNEGRRVEAVEIKNDLRSEAQKKFKLARDELYYDNIMVDEITAEDVCSKKYERFFEAVDKSENQLAKAFATEGHAYVIFSRNRVYTSYDK